ncbi:hypothetical protein T05_8702 [Trichinella murrelli]|uniref:Uncharacterized protein n=1 Tax=Trichinella murrelli TaxID=144512 RepID=A0A0V0T9P1_9BILA|nr:hypothetical protein T05_8702 [Trichinella murrelli]
MLSVTPESISLVSVRQTEHERNVFVTLSSVETEKELKHSFQVVSRWKAVYNETPVEFIPEEGKTRRCIRLNINQMFSITPGNISLVSVHQTEPSWKTEQE